MNLQDLTSIYFSVAFYLLVCLAACSSNSCEFLDEVAFGVDALHRDLLESEALSGQDLSSYVRLSSRVHSGEVPSILFDKEGLYYQVIEPTYTRDLLRCVRSGGYFDVVEWLMKSGTMDDFAVLPSVQGAQGSNLPVPVQYACLVYIYNAAELQR